MFNDAAEEIRRLLHQFAAGFLRQVPAPLMKRLEEHELALSAPPPAELAELAESQPGAEPAEAAADLSEAQAEGRAETQAEAQAEPDMPVDAAEPLPETLPQPLFSDELGQPAMTAFAELPQPAPSRARVREDALDDDDDIDAVDLLDEELFPIFVTKARNCCRSCSRACATGRAGRPSWRPLRPACARCTPSRAVRVWPARCAWARWRTGWKPPSNTCWRRARPAAPTSKRC